MKKIYVVSKDKDSGLYYAHLKGYSYIPVFGSFGSKAHAERSAAEKMYLSLKEYRQLKAIKQYFDGGKYNEMVIG